MISDAYPALLNGCVIAVLGVVGYLLKRCIERVEDKMDALVEQRAECLQRFVPRDEYDRGMTRMHGRMDEHIAVEESLSARLARVEGARQSTLCGGLQ